MTSKPLPTRTITSTATAVVLSMVFLAGIAGCADARHGNHSKTNTPSANASGGGIDVSKLRIRPITTTTNGDADVTLTSQNAVTDGAAPAKPVDDAQAYVIG